MGSEAMEHGTSSAGGDDSWEMVDLASMKNFFASSLTLVDSDAPLSSNKSQISSAAVSSFSDSPRIEALPDPEGVDSFLRESLQGKDRLTILRLEQEVEKFMRNSKVQQLEFQPMPSSYLRLVAHRVVQHYNLQSAVADSSTPEGVRIIARKTPDTRFPRVRLADIPVGTQAAEKQVHTAQQKFELKRRPSKSSKYNRESNGPAELSSQLNPAKSVEERKEEYNRARARIFNNSDLEVKMENESLVLESNSVMDSFICDKKGEQPNDGLVRGELYSGAARLVSGKMERESTALYKVNSRVAIFRDREKDRKDPDYDRNYDRYMQRFDPGIGVSLEASSYGVQAIHTPVASYNTEFPQLSGSIQPQVSVEPPLHRPPRQPLRGPWAGSTSGLNYGHHPDSMMGSFNAVPQSGSGIYMHPQQFPCPDPTLALVLSQERFSQSVTQPHEGSFSQTSQSVTQPHAGSFSQTQRQ